MQNILTTVLNEITNGKFNHSNNTRKGQLGNGTNDTGASSSMENNAETGIGRTQLLRSTEQTDRISETINIDGVSRPTRNSNGKLIHPTEVFTEETNKAHGSKKQ